MRIATLGHRSAIAKLVSRHFLSGAIVTKTREHKKKSEKNVGDVGKHAAIDPPTLLSSNRRPDQSDVIKIFY